jgi:hypothetical protein
MSLDLSNFPILDITGGVDPKNSNWRTDKVLYGILCERYTKMVNFMKLLGVNTLSTRLLYKDIEFRVLIDNGDLVPDVVPTPAE